MLIFSFSNPVLQIAGRGVRLFASHKESRAAIKKCYQMLGIAEDCEDEILRLAFVNLAKRFHPDSGTNEACANRFFEIENAYRQIQRSRFEERQREVAQNPDVEEFDIKHTAPQHRHYLVHDMGLGSPNIRQRRHTAERARKALENVLEHRLKEIQAEERNSIVGMDKKRARDVKTRFGMDRLVEDLIQEAMNRGEFSDLAGAGKPLKEKAYRQNPYVDFVTHKLNQVLIDNGFTPEWIQLSKEIREDTAEIRKQLREARNKLGDQPLTNIDQHKWNNTIQILEEKVKKINSKVDKYNLLVPVLQKQMLQFNLKAVANETLSVPPDKKEIESKLHTLSKSKGMEEGNLMQLITSIFSK